MFLKLKTSLLIGTLFLLSSCIGTDLVDGIIGPDLSNVSLDQEELVLIVGEAQRLTAQYQDETGTDAATTFSWSSDQPEIASVDQNGEVTAIAPGQSSITVTSENGKTATALVTVIIDANAIASINITNTSGVLEPGNSLQLSANISNGLGDPINGIEVTWSSSDPEIAQVGASTGLVEALSPGKANITASAEGINSLPFEITVNSGDLSGTFTGLSGYSVSGSVTRTQDEDGNVVIQLEEDFSTQSGPGLYLYLGQSGTSGANSVSIDKLQARSGTQTYVIPSNINANDFDFVLIFCQPFNVVFGSAELQ